MPYLFLIVNFFLTKFTYVNIITSRTPVKAGNTGHGPEYHTPPPVDVPHKYRARQAVSLWERESTRRQGRGNEVGPGEGAPARMAVCVTAGRKAAGGGDESAARVDASCEQPVKPGRFLTSHQPGAIRAGNEAGKCGRIPGKRVLWRQGMDMKKRILTYLQFSLQGTGVAALGTLNIYEPKAETLIFGGVCIICGLIIAIVNKEA